jgi:glutamyl-Q tRNA(Asp) synthetase
MSSTYIGRFAPSPTGSLHMGSLLAALASYLDARAHGGQWLLRIDDIDQTRCRPQHVDDILRTLTRFGLTWDGDVTVQTTRLARYEEALMALADMQRLYACQCSRREIADSANGVTGIDGLVYPGTCRQLLLNQNTLNTPQAIRLNTEVSAATIMFQDRCQGTQTQQVSQDVGDFVLKRRDGLHTYQLSVVVDDADAAVTHVVRGADLLDSTPRQILLQTLLGVPTPSYLHIPVLTNAEGQKLSKQTLAASISDHDVMATLRYSLKLLSQPLSKDYYDNVEQLLDYAVRQWQPEKIPSVRSIYDLSQSIT